MTTARERIEQLRRIYKRLPHIVVETETIRELLAELDAKCRWKRREESGSKLTIWFTECGNYRNDPIGNYCPHCGKEIVSE
jgi:hypothetical protein